MRQEILRKRKRVDERYSESPPLCQPCPHASEGWFQMVEEMPRERAGARAGGGGGVRERESARKVWCGLLRVYARVLGLGVGYEKQVRFLRMDTNMATLHSLP